MDRPKETLLFAFLFGIQGDVASQWWASIIFNFCSIILVIVAGVEWYLERKKAESERRADE